MQAEHENIEKYECDHCGKRFKYNTSKLVHVRAMHESNRKFECEICFKSFALRPEYMKHKNKHDNKEVQKQFKCDPCDVAFEWNHQLQNHLKNTKHESVYSHSCSACDKKFITKGKMTRHFRIIHENLKVSCKLCGKEIGF